MNLKQLKLILATKTGMKSRTINTKKSSMNLHTGGFDDITEKIMSFEITEEVKTLVKERIEEMEKEKKKSKGQNNKNADLTMFSVTEMEKTHKKG